MSDHSVHHGHDGSFGRTLQPDDLAAEFGDSPLDSPHTSHLVLDEPYARLLSQEIRIVEHQWRNDIQRGMVRGFCLSGPPGTGKTVLAKLLGYELGRRVPLTDSGVPVVTVLIDGGDVARAKYGESEQRIKEIFHWAQHGPASSGQRSVLIFDDVESIFMSRDSAHAKEWHFSQDSVFFHAVDEMDTSRTVVVLTTNRPDLVDHAIRDRFIEYKVDYPSATLLREVARRRARDQLYSDIDLEELDLNITQGIADGTVRSIRDAQHFTLQHYVSSVLKGV